jgi:hypothetical protein
LAGEGKGLFSLSGKHEPPLRQLVIKHPRIKLIK